MQDVSRVGYISTVNPDAGMAKVHYPETGNTTSDLPLYKFGDEYRMPKIGDQVIVIHLSNDSSSGIILGKFWDETDPPKEKEGYRKGFHGRAFEKVQENIYTLHADEIILEGSAGSISLSKLISLEKRIEALERRE